MNLVQDRKPLTLLFNPFAYIAGGKALGIGLGAILLAGFLGSLGQTHFDGVLDTHTGSSAPLGVFLAEGLADWLCLALVLLVLGRIFSQTSFRTIDLLGTQAMARWPSILISLVMLPPSIRRFTHGLIQFVLNPDSKLEFSSTDAIIFFAAAFVMLPLVIWMVVLMYKSYSVSCNLRGAKAVLTFILGLILAEILSKFAVYSILRLSP